MTKILSLFKTVIPLFCFLTVCNTGICAVSNNDGNKIADSVISAIENQINTNSSVEKKEKEFVLNINFDDNFDFMVSTGCTWIQSESELNATIADLCTDFTNFNTFNTSLVQHFVVIVNFPDAILKSGFTEGMSESGTQVPDYIETQSSDLNYLSYESLTQLISQRLQTEFDNGVFGDTENRIVTLQYRANWIKNSSSKKRQATSTTHYKKGSEFLSENFTDFKLLIPSANNNGDQYIYNVIETSIAYFSGLINGNANCSDLLENFSENGQAYNYLNNWCNSINNGEEGFTNGNIEFIQQVIFPIAQFINSNSSLDGNYDYSVDEDYLIISPNEYLDLLNDPYSDVNGYFNYLHSLVNELNSICDPSGAENVFSTVSYLAHYGNQDFFNQLSHEQLLCFVELFVYGWNNSLFNVTNGLDEYTFFLKLFKTYSLDQTNRSPNKCKQMLEKITSLSGGVSALYDAAANFFISGNEFLLVKAINDVALKANNLQDETQLINYINSNGTEHVLMWEPGPGNPVTELLQGNELTERYTYEYDNYNSFGFQFRYCTEVNTASTEFLLVNEGIDFNIQHPASCKTRGFWLDYGVGTSGGSGIDVQAFDALKPFDVICLLNTDNIHIFNGDNTALGTTFPMTAFSLHWMIRTQSNEELMSLISKVALAITIVTLPAYAPIFTAGTVFKIIGGAVIINDFLLSQITDDMFFQAIDEYVDAGTAYEMTQIFSNTKNALDATSVVLGIYMPAQSATKLVGATEYVGRSKALHNNIPEGNLVELNINGKNILDDIYALRRGLSMKVDDYSAGRNAEFFSRFGLTNTSYANTKVGDILMIAATHGKKQELLSILNALDDAQLQYLLKNLDETPGLAKWIGREGSEGYTAWKHLDETNTAEIFSICN